jgi:Dna[CI] antecedent, DciA
MPAHTRHTLTLASALESSEPLARLSQRMRDSRQRFESIQAALPAALAGQLKPGPLDDAGWTLLAANSAVAAKLRQLVPDLQSTLSAAGHSDLPIRVRILPA